MSSEEEIRMDTSAVGGIPCYKEELTTGKVIRNFKKAVPGAEVYVFDNNQPIKRQR
jgi:hypothetical protein